MTSNLPHKRPNCDDIIQRRKKWAMKVKELQINDELEKIIDSKRRENELTIYSLFKSEMISDKVIRSKYRHRHECVTT
jgi:hypothetical protein